jgi:VIT1/CCC1 family predicted Fe2+/Mn2+ transporter
MKKKGIVASIMAALKLGEEGKIGSFFNKLENEFEREIKSIQHNIKGEELEHDHAVESLKAKIEDAKKAIEDAWMNITAEQVATNAMQESFKSDYLTNVTRKEMELERLEDQLKRINGSYESSIKDLNEQIEKYEARLAKIRG